MIDFKNYKRLTIPEGEIKFYDSIYNKCSNSNVPEIREKLDEGIPVSAIEGYRYCSYTAKEISDMYSRLSELESMIEQGKLVERVESKTSSTREQLIREMGDIIKAEFIEWLDVTGCLPEGTSYYYECLGCVEDGVEKLYNLGYRKKEEIEKQVTEDILDKISTYYGGDFYVELYKKYGVQVE